MSHAEYLPQNSRIRVSDELLAFAQDHLLEGDAPDKALTKVERLQLRTRAESFAHMLAQDPDFRGMPGHVADVEATCGTPAAAS